MYQGDKKPCIWQAQNGTAALVNQQWNIQKLLLSEIIQNNATSQLDIIKNKYDAKQGCWCS